MAKVADVKPDRVLVTEVVGPGKSEWSMRPDQAEKHLATFAAQSSKLPAGDVAAIKDCASEFKKQADS